MNRASAVSLALLALSRPAFAAPYDVGLFKVSCAQGILTMRYPGDREVRLKRGDAMTLILDEREHKLRVRLIGKELVGRIALSHELRAEITDAKVINVDAPNAMGEPWYFDSAPPLKRAAKECPR